MTEPEFEDFLKRVRWQLNLIAGSCCNGNADAAGERALALCGEVHAKISAMQMNRERAAVGTLNLASLPPARDVDLFERGED